MAAAHLNVIRVGESVWSTWEPRNGEFHLDWLEPVLDAAHERGIKVIIGTPTYAAPPWLQTAYPEIAVERKTGQRAAWGARQEIDYSHPAFRFHAERVIRAILNRYAQHPAIIGYQVDNEPGLELIHNHGTFTEFVRRLKATYGTTDNLNAQWGLTYWSHRIDDWSELWRPDGNSVPQYDLAWRRYQADVTNEFIEWQAGLVAEYRRPEQFVTTCLQYPRPGLDDEKLGRVLDVISGNPYYGMQDHLERGTELAQPNGWTTTGIAGLFRQADRIYSSRQARYLVTETNAQAIGDSHMNCPPYPGQLRQAAYAFISRGAAMIEYWHWHTLPYGAETYWGGVLPHSLEPGRVYDEVAAIGAELATLGGALDGFEPDADVAILWSVPSRFAMQHLAPLARPDGDPDRESYEKIVDAFHRGVIDSGRQARIIHASQALDLGAEKLVEKFPVLVAAAHYIAADEDIELLRRYVALGGHLILGPRTAYADEEARARIAVAPEGLHEEAGTWYEEFSNLEQPIKVVANGNELALSDGAAGSRWIDGLHLKGAQVLASYDHPHFGVFPAVTTNASGNGRVTTVGTVPTPELATAVMEWAAPQAAGELLDGEVPNQVTVSSGSMPDGTRAFFVFNWSWDEQKVALATDAHEPAADTAHVQGSALSLTAWGCRVFIAQTEPTREEA
jgi:beta-galactosidase